MDFFNMPRDQLLLLGAVILITLTLMRRIINRPKRMREIAQRPTAPAGRFSSHDQEQLNTGAAFDDTAVKLHDLFREMNARIDTKAQVLNELLLEADAKIAELKRIVSQQGIPPAPASSRRLQSPVVPEANPVIPAGDDPMVIDMDAAGDAQKQEFLADRFADVYRLADMGLTATEIGERTRQSAGEIELILTLRRGRQRGASQSNTR